MPERIVSGKTVVISPIALYRWYKWVVLFREIYVTYLDVLMVLGRDLGPTIEIGPVMTMKVLKKIARLSIGLWSGH